MTASLRARRVSNTSCREAVELTHAEWPVLVAILPSAVIAYFSTLKGRPVRRPVDQRLCMQTQRKGTFLSYVCHTHQEAFEISIGQIQMLINAGGSCPGKPELCPFCCPELCPFWGKRASTAEDSFSCASAPR